MSRATWSPPEDTVPALMGILNVTPDSFSDGGQFATAQSAVDAALRMRDEGADLIDVGGESTRPGAEEVPAEDELRRVLPVVEALAQRGVPVSIDTRKAIVARAALEAGAAVVNDVTALGDPDMAPVCASFGVPVVLMHMQGTPQTMQRNPQYGDVVAEVCAFLTQQAHVAEAAGIHQIWLDPGIGFGKTTAHNLALLRHLDALVATGYPVLLGVSRKAFIGRIVGGEATPAPVHERQEGTLAVQTLAQAAGVRMIRAHDVLAARRAIDVAGAVLNAV